ncbi:ladinin-1 [Coregonus clupeaformis]|uniref:ladinin-1 n=1 Tax=Coregonus clupeaformis TaxID=59861 RepID=UPI001E1C8147|nr:ladinin-1 [Coregonus clupeaformis]
MSPHSPTTPLSPARGAQSHTHYGHTECSVNVSSVSLEQTARPAFARQSSRTVSFRMLRKKEEESMPLQRSASVRMASKTFEPSSSDQTEDQDKAAHFQRNSRQRVSSRSIQEKMERLAHAAQKSESPRSPDVAQRTLFLLDEVSKKRGLFEKDQAAAPCSPGVLRQETRRFASGISNHINRWVSKTNRPGGSVHKPMDLHHVDISSKRSTFESAGRTAFLTQTPHTKVDK